MLNPELRLFTGSRPTADRSPQSLPAHPGSQPEQETESPSATEAERQAQRRERELDRIAGTNQAKTVSVSLGSIVPLLLDAVENNRAWIRDFADESVRIDADLYDVLLAYQQLRRPAAA